MGNNASGACAIIFMDFIESQILLELKEKILLWKRYVDDVFLICKDTDGEKLVEICNDIHPNISFTIEEPTTKELPYLDILLNFQHDRVAFTLYTKSCESRCVILPWISQQPRTVKINAIRNDFRRAISHGSNDILSRRGLNIIKQKYRQNGYPQALLKRIERSANFPVKKKQELKKLFLTMPYKNENQVREVRRTVEKCNLKNYVTISFTSKKITSYLRPRNKPLCKPNCKFCAANLNNSSC